MDTTARDAETIHRVFLLFGLNYHVLKVDPGSVGVSERAAQYVTDTADTLVEIGTADYNYPALMHDLIDGLTTAQRQARRA